MSMSAKAIRHSLVSKGLVRPAVDQRSRPGHVVAVRRVDDRPSTRVIPVVYKSAR